MYQMILNTAQALAVVAAGIAAVGGLNTWRRQMIVSKKTDLAEETLIAFYSARDAIGWAREPRAHSGEGETREASGHEDDNIRKLRNAYFVPIERLHNDRDTFSKIQAVRYRFMAYFGENKLAPFKTIRDVQSEVRVAAGMLIRTADMDLSTDGEIERHEKHRKAIWIIDENEDEIAKKVDDAVREIEAVCRPYLSGAKAG